MQTKYREPVDPHIGNPVMSSHTLRIATVGLSNRTEHAIKLFLEKTYASVDHVGFDDSPDCIIFDVDQPVGRSKWQRYLNTALHDSCSSVLLSLSGYGDADCRCFKKSCVALRKPVRLSQLQDALTHLRGKQARPEQPDIVIGEAGGAERKPAPPRAPRDIQTDSSLFSAAQHLPGKTAPIQISSKTRIDPNDIDALKQARYDPRQYFQGFLQSILSRNKNKDTVIHISTANGPIALNLESGKANVHLSKYRFRTLCSMPADLTLPLPWRQISGVDKPDSNPHKKDTSIDGLLWVAAIWASRGRLPRSLDPEQPVHMRYWPNLTRLTAIPHAMNIAALWSRGDRSPLETAQVLHIDPRHVFTFASACHAIGLLAQVPQSAAAARVGKEKNQPHKHRSLLGRLLARISLFSRNGDET